MKRTLITYALYKENEGLDFFLDNGVIYDENVDYIFVVNVDNEFKPSEKFNNTIQGVSAKVFQRDNVGLDFGGYSCVVDRISKSRLIDSYDYFIFMNQTITGPLASEGVWDGKSHWSNLFTQKINDKDKLVGITINCFSFPCMYTPDPHVQSMIFATDKIGLNLAIEKNIFDYKNILTDKDEIVVKKEIELSRVFLNAGYNISCMLPSYEGEDFTQGLPKNAQGCVWSMGHVFAVATETGWEWFHHDNPPDIPNLVFLKNNR